MIRPFTGYNAGTMKTAEQYAREAADLARTGELGLNRPVVVRKSAATGKTAAFAGMSPVQINRFKHQFLNIRSPNVKDGRD